MDIFANITGMKSRIRYLQACRILPRSVGIRTSLPPVTGVSQVSLCFRSCICSRNWSLRAVSQTPCSELGPRSFEVLFAACESLAEGTLSGFDVQTTKGCVAHTFILHANHWQITVVQFTRGSIRAVTSTVVEVSRFFVDDLRLDYSVIHYRLIIIEPIQQ